MISRRFLQLDVFATRAGGGNPLAVVLDAEGLDDAAMQAIARWTRLPETTFVFPSGDDGASYRLRMFSPQKEVPFAGHPSVGTAHAVLEAGLAQPREGVLVQDGIAGRLPLQVHGGGATRSIAIRTLLAVAGRVYFSAGGGIVADSEPEQEYRETLDKARGMIDALATLHGAADR